MDASRKTKSCQLAGMIRKMIVSGSVKPGTQLEAVARMAERYGTTIATVSKALDILEQGNFVERFPGKGIFARKENKCRLLLVIDDGLSVSSSRNVFLPVLMHELDLKCRTLGYSYKTLLNVCDRNSSGELNACLASESFDSVLIASRWVAENAGKIFKNTNSLLLGLFDYKDLNVTITFDAYSMARRAVGRLAGLGCSSIAFIGSDQDFSWRKKRKSYRDGYIDGLADIKMLYDRKLDFAEVLSPEGGSIGFNKIFRYMQHDKRFGIVVSDSILAEGVIQSAILKSVRMPEQLLIATQSNKGGGSGFPVPLIRYESNVTEVVDKILELNDLYMEGGSPESVSSGMEEVFSSELKGLLV